MPEYVPVTKEQLLYVLRDIVQHVEDDDSWEGFVNYLMPDPGVHDDSIVALLHARYRIGNADGQGGMTVIGDLISEAEEAARDAQHERISDLLANNVVVTTGDSIDSITDKIIKVIEGGRP